jgi:hypothetical protein
MTMAKDQDPFQLLTATEQMTKQTQGAMESYFGWLQKTMSIFPWSNTNLNTILLNNATQNVTAVFLRLCRNLAKPRISKRSSKFKLSLWKRKCHSFNEQAKILGEIYSKAAQDAMKRFT